MVQTRRYQRVRDPIHGLIILDMDDPVDALCWDLVNTREFQRLRRIKQLGFSELVYPGATHSRLAHSLGVFSNARKLVKTIEERTGEPVAAEQRATVIAAALLHDIGHGPFSHAFETALKGAGIKRNHELWSAEIIQGDTQVRHTLERFQGGLSEQVAALLRRKDPKDIYDSVVHSQFDADRLDYVCRDKYMTGIGSGAVDSEWLFDCLEVGEIQQAHGDDEDIVTVPGFYLNGKGLQAAEGYLLGRYHLYAQVYMHKTTRAAEAMLSALLTRCVARVRAGEQDAIGLQPDDVLVRFMLNPGDMDAYLSLDDSVLWSTLERIGRSPAPLLASLARRLRDRDLYKCLDLGERTVGRGGEEEIWRFREALKKRFTDDIAGATLLEDRPKLSAYTRFGADEPGAFQRVMIGSLDPDRPPINIAERSDVIKAIEDRKLYRVYVSAEEGKDVVEQLWRERRR